MLDISETCGHHHRAGAMSKEMPTKIEVDRQCKEVCSYCADYGEEDPLDDILYYREIDGEWCHGHWVCAASEIRQAAAGRGGA